MMNDDIRFRTPGVIITPRDMEPPKGKDNPEGIKPPVTDKEPEIVAVPRPDGKALCEYLRSVRKEIAKANGIELKTEECTYNGSCAGTCPRCDEEIWHLNAELGKIPAKERVYPNVQKYEEKKGKLRQSILAERAGKYKEPRKNV